MGESEDLIHGLLHDGGNKHGIVRTYMGGRNMSTHDIWYLVNLKRNLREVNTL